MKYDGHFNCRICLSSCRGVILDSKMKCRPFKIELTVTSQVISFGTRVTEIDPWLLPRWPSKWPLSPFRLGDGSSATSNDHPGNLLPFLKSILLSKDNTVSIHMIHSIHLDCSCSHHREFSILLQFFPGWIVNESFFFFLFFKRHSYNYETLKRAFLIKI